MQQLSMDQSTRRTAFIRAATPCFDLVYKVMDQATGLPVQWFGWRDLKERLHAIGQSEEGETKHVAKIIYRHLLKSLPHALLPISHPPSPMLPSPAPVAWSPNAAVADMPTATRYSCVLESMKKLDKTRVFEMIVDDLIAQEEVIRDQVVAFLPVIFASSDKQDEFYKYGILTEAELNMIFTTASQDETRDVIKRFGQELQKARTRSHRDIHRDVVMTSAQFMAEYTPTFAELRDIWFLSILQPKDKSGGLGNHARVGELLDRLDPLSKGGRANGCKWPYDELPHNDSRRYGHHGARAK
jgi:hypothetical protein